MLIIFENAGEIDPRLISTFGVNVKESDNPIGFFGTGLKYAIAILVRMGHDITIQAGERSFAFTKSPTTIRGKTFDLVAMNGEPLGFTTDVGKSWQLWMAYRELCCNAKDEQGKTYEVDAAPEPTAGLTRVIVRGDDFVQVHRTRRLYFLESAPLLISQNVEFHEGESKGFFYRGVRVLDMPTGRVSRFTYNILHRLELTEDRTASESYMVEHYIRQAIMAADNDEVIRDCLTAEDDHLEGSFAYSDQFQKPGAAFIDAVATLTRDRVGHINASAVGVYQKTIRAKLSPDTVSLTGVEEEILRRAKHFASRLGFNITYDIIVAESLGENVLGLAKDNRIYLAQRAFMMGTKTVAGTIIEEFIHLKHGHQDCSRDMQNYLLDRLVSLGEELIGEPV